MKILSFKPGHDGTIAGLDTASGELLFSFESEKDSFPRYTPITPDSFIEAGLWFNEIPDVLALSGWSKTGMATASASGAGYLGIGKGSEIVQHKTFFGKSLKHYSSTHERSHIWGAYGMSPFEQGEPVYLLIWEGALGDFYEITEELEVVHIGRVMNTPGNKYSFLYALADPSFRMPKGQLRNEDPGKLMAIAAFGNPGPMSAAEKEITDFLLCRDSILATLDKPDLSDSPYHNIGVQSQEFKDLALKYSDEIFSRFYEFAKANLPKKLPLLIAGGCGLNCEWNTKWKQSGLFDGVFIPPCTNDTGSAIGTAVDAMRHFTGKAKVSWTPYAGQAFNDDRYSIRHELEADEDLVETELNFDQVAEFLATEHVIGWARGCCEIGPRALGNRSILAAPFSQKMLRRLNAIKGREGFRPVAPICLLEDVSKHFEWEGESPYMLHFQKVKDGRLQTITHVDGSARVQTVSEQDNKAIHGLLLAFREKTGAGVLCNTSLNFHGTGFINRTSDLYSYAKTAGLDGFVAGNAFYRFKSRTSAMS